MSARRARSARPCDGAARGRRPAADARLAPRTRGSSSSATTLGWALDDEAAYVTAVARAAGYRARAAGLGARSRGGRSSSTRATSPGSTRAGRARPTVSGSRTSTAGPGRPGYPEFDRAYEALAARPRPLRARPGDATGDGGARRSRRASPPARVHRIPIGIELDAFPLVDAGAARGRAARARAPAGRVRRRLVPEGRDGFGDGLEPKSIKGPDVLVEALAARRRATSPTSSSSSPGPRAATSARGSTDRGVRSRPPAPRRTRRARRRVPRARRLRRSPRGRRAARRASSSRWRRACRSSRPVPGRRRTSSSTA